MQLKVRPEPRLPNLQVCRAPRANTQLSARAVPAPRPPFSLASSTPPRCSAQKPCSDDDTHHPPPHPQAARNTPYNSLMLLMVLGLLLRLGNSH